MWRHCSLRRTGLVVAPLNAADQALVQRDSGPLVELANCFGGFLLNSQTGYADPNVTPVEQANRSILEQVC